MYRLALIILLSPLIVLLIFSMAMFVWGMWGLHPALGAVAVIVIYGVLAGKYKS